MAFLLDILFTYENWFNGISVQLYNSQKLLHIESLYH